MSRELPNLFDICTPREDVLRGSLRDESLAADLSKVIDGNAPPEYLDPKRFFAQTHPTEGLKTLLKQVLLRLQGTSQEVSSIFRLDTQFGGGKTHGLIALYHAAKGMKDVPNASDFVDTALLPSQPARVAAFDGDNADPTNGILREGLKIFTPWGFLAYQLAGVEGYNAVRESDITHTAPGAETFGNLLKQHPSIILLDEMAIYLRRVRDHKQQHQLTPFLTSLIKAVEGTPKAALIFSLAIGKDRKGSDAYAEENTLIAKTYDELESVSARKATVLEPTSTDETALVLQKRLFSSIDKQKAEQVIQAYVKMWKKEKLEEKIRSSQGDSEESQDPLQERFLRDYPFHPDLMHIFKDKLSTHSLFQRVRGMLRLLSRAISQLWELRPPHTYSLHPHHLDPGYEPIQAEIVTRLQLAQYEPAIRKDISHYRDKKAPLLSAEALAQVLDRENYKTLPPYASQVARTIFWHTLVFNNKLSGLSRERLLFATLAPHHERAFLEDACQQFQERAAYLNDDPTKPLSFLSEANLNQIIRQEESLVSEEDITHELKNCIIDTFSSKQAFLAPIFFPGDPSDVPDDLNRNQPRLLIMNYDTVPFTQEAAASNAKVPSRVRDLFLHTGSNRSFRQLQNHLVFLLADRDKIHEMQETIKRHLALRSLKTPEKIKDLSEHQQKKVTGECEKSKSACAISIQRCYRHLLYPSHNEPLEKDLWLAHANLFSKLGNTSQPGKGQEPILQTLKELYRLYYPSDPHPAPTLLIHKTPLAHSGCLSSFALRSQFYKSPKLPILLDDNTFLACIRKGIEDHLLVYQYESLTYGAGDPPATIKIDENAFIFTLEEAKKKGIWPRPLPPAHTPEPMPAHPHPEEKGGIEETPTPPSSDDFTLRREDNLPEILRDIEQEFRRRGARRLRSFSCTLYHLPEFTHWLMQAPNAFKDANIRLDVQIDFCMKQHNSKGQLEFEGHPEDLRSVIAFIQNIQSQRRGEIGIQEATFSFAFDPPLALPDESAFSTRMRPLEKQTQSKCVLSLSASTKEN